MKNYKTLIFFLLLFWLSKRDVDKELWIICKNSCLAVLAEETFIPLFHSLFYLRFCVTSCKLLGFSSGFWCKAVDVQCCQCWWAVWLQIFLQEVLLPWFRHPEDMWMSVMSQKWSGTPRENSSVSCGELNHLGAGVAPLSGSGWDFTQLQLPFRFPSCSMEWVLPLDLDVTLLYQVFVIFKSVINIIYYLSLLKLQRHTDGAKHQEFHFLVCKRQDGNVQGCCLDQKEVKCGKEWNLWVWRFRHLNPEQYWAPVTGNSFFGGGSGATIGKSVECSSAVTVIWIWCSDFWAVCPCIKRKWLLLLVVNKFTF